MAQVKKRFDISLDIKKSTSNRAFEVVEGDTGNVLEITLTDDGADVDLSGCFVQAVFSKSDGYTATQHNLGAGIIPDASAVNRFEIALYPASFSPGMVECEIQVYSKDTPIRELADVEGSTLSTSAKFNFSCRRSIGNDGALESDPSWPTLVSLIETCNEMEKELNDISEAETIRTTAENERVAHENTRVDAEKKRQSAEQQRISAENARQTAETQRSRAETERIKAEAARKALADQFANMTVSADEVEPGDPPTADFTLDGTQAHIAFGIPSGRDLATHITGVSITLSI